MCKAWDDQFKSGEKSGGYTKVISQVRKIKAKGISPEVYAEFNEEDISFVQQIYTELEKHPQYTDDEIYDELNRQLNLEGETNDVQTQESQLV